MNLYKIITMYIATFRHPYWKNETLHPYVKENEQIKYIVSTVF